MKIRLKFKINCDGKLGPEAALYLIIFNEDLVQVSAVYILQCGSKWIGTITVLIQFVSIRPLVLCKYRTEHFILEPDEVWVCAHALFLTASYYSTRGVTVEEFPLRWNIAQNNIIYNTFWTVSTSVSGINRLLYGWFKARELAHQPSSSAFLLLCKATSAVMSPVTDRPFKCSGLLMNGLQGHRRPMFYFFKC